MAQSCGFDNSKYLQLQSSRIHERVEKFSKLYLEFGGKLFDDCHAARVLPGFDLNEKVKLLEELKDDAEIIFCISANSIEKNKIRSDLGITYDLEVLRLIDNLRKRDLLIGAVVITMFSGQAGALRFKQQLEARGIKVAIHYPIKGYPSDVEAIISEEGYGSNPFVETTRNLVVVTAPGPGCGKLATCLSQLYHESKRGVKAGYSKFETFPVWNLPIDHPVNLAYEAATVDLKDKNLIDPFHLKKYGVETVNYNRDIEVFPVVDAILKKILGYEVFASPTDMGVNMVGKCIVDPKVVEVACKREIIRRYLDERVKVVEGISSEDNVKELEKLLERGGIQLKERVCIEKACTTFKESDRMTMCLESPDGTCITGKSSKLMVACGSAILNAVKSLAGIPDKIDIISPSVLEPLLRLKTDMLKMEYPQLHLEEVLHALAISAATNPSAKAAVDCLPLIRGWDAHCSHIISRNDKATLFKLGVTITSEAVFSSKDLYSE
ncbi:putative ATP-dependent Zn protease [Monocercomonoides exilis]|uniref:putative ATP-dependent Zn protease n=1 Tax=Monocercomonoides exilis TaxID=2049356 RepID=UPI00355A260B|nr:putative ATP-dependent Zn protease [Monocercomonoides exilis]|eukprot:MONOS_7352.1-p1 / transcript=MONOS_7352.1 / gene=MONOS_7352 / organism=Monocercomonoides_exilis_PA203 / gene_product=ATP-dependent Zn protease / transcript_product=ATP-dependent Zn protease / location=Mono_scaffold00249:37262-38746(-) / protein_length=495 / sequence_SO=supercontig / SO=protein_coding / is_pseudo=false